jgi:hypothetical protein
MAQLHFAGTMEAKSMYRKILRAAARWPSIKRAAMIEEIKAEFRRNAAAPLNTTPALLQQARDGLDTLQRQTRARTDSSFSFR